MRQYYSTQSTLKCTLEFLVVKVKEIKRTWRVNDMEERHGEGMKRNLEKIKRKKNLEVHV
jgi:hypothetical protein